MFKSDKTVKCRICKTPTPMLGSKLCDRCWELETRIKMDPEIARKILRSLSTKATMIHRFGWIPVIGAGLTLDTVIGSLVLVIFGLCLITGKSLVLGFAGSNPTEVNFGHSVVGGEATLWFVLLTWIVPLNARRFAVVQVKKFVNRLRDKKEDSNGKAST